MTFKDLKKPSLMLCVLFTMASCQSKPRFRVIEGPGALKIMNKWIKLDQSNLGEIKLGYYLGGFAQDRAQFYLKFTGPTKSAEKITKHFSFRKFDPGFPCTDDPDGRIKGKIESWWKPQELKEAACYTGSPDGYAGCRVDFSYEEKKSLGYLSIRCG